MHRMALWLAVAVAAGQQPATADDLTEALDGRVNVALASWGTQAQASSERNPGAGAAGAINGQWSGEQDRRNFTGWLPENWRAPHWLRLDLGEQRAIDRIVLRHNPESVLIDYRLQWAPSPDGPWQDLVEPIYGNDDRVTLHTFPPRRVRHLRLWIITSNSRLWGGQAGVAELEAYAPEGTVGDPPRGAAEAPSLAPAYAGDDADFFSAPAYIWPGRRGRWDGRPLHLVGPCGGTVSGWIVFRNVRSDGDGEGDDAVPEAVAGDLRRIDGEGRIPASYIELHYGTSRKDLTGRDDFDFGRHPVPLVLAEHPVHDDNALRVWVTVRVPEDAAAGEYHGQVSLGDREAPLRLRVSGFRLPPRSERHTLLNLIQSPDSVALRYGVRPYSDEHFQLLERSVALKARAGANIVRIPIIRNAWEGDRTGMIQLRRDGEELVADLRAFERYMRLHVRHEAPPRLVILGLWDAYMVDRECPMYDRIEVTERTADGKLRPLELEMYPANRELWESVIDGARQTMSRVGLDPDTLRIGTSTDWQPAPETGNFFREIAPDLTWASLSHGHGVRMTDKGALAGGDHHRDPYSAFEGEGSFHITFLETPLFAAAPVVAPKGGGASDPDRPVGDPNEVVDSDYPQGPLRGGWEPRPVVVLHCPRGLFGDTTYGESFGMPIFLRWPDLTVGMNRRFGRGQWSFGGFDRGQGLGHLGLDYWELPPQAGEDLEGIRGVTYERDGSRRVLRDEGGDRPWRLWGDYAEAPRSFNPIANMERGRRLAAVTAPGPDGAIPTVRLFLLQEGFQYVQARLAVERAIAEGRAPRSVVEQYARVGPLPVGTNRRGQTVLDRSAATQPDPARFEYMFDMAAQVQAAEEAGGR